MDARIDDLPGRIRASLLGALCGEQSAGTAAGAADLLGVAETAAACDGFDEAELRKHGLERPSRSGSAGLLLRALPFGLLSPLDRPRLRRDAYRCVALAGADEGTAIAGVAAALLVADLMRFDLHEALVRVRQSLLEDAPMALLNRLSVASDAGAASDADPVVALQTAISALDSTDTAPGAVAAVSGGPPAALTLAGALAGARWGAAAVEGLAVEELPYGERALPIARRLGDHAAAAITEGPRPTGYHPIDGR